MDFRDRRSWAVSWIVSIGPMNPLCLIWPNAAALEADLWECINQTSLPGFQLWLANRKHQQERILIVLHISCARLPWQCLHASPEGFSPCDWLCHAGSGNCSHSSHPFPSVSDMASHCSQPGNPRVLHHTLPVSLNSAHSL